MNELNINTVESSELVEQTFKFWLEGDEIVRSPFPFYIHLELKEKATDRFYNWANGLKPEAKDELNDEAIGEKFEEIIFETALNLVKTEDEKITILYPFLPRTGDPLKNREGLIDSKVVDRDIIKKDGNKHLKLVCEKTDSKEHWTTSIELPF
jgi:hypothetical protein